MGRGGAIFEHFAFVQMVEHFAFVQMVGDRIATQSWLLEFHMLECRYTQYKWYYD
jgi:hypothetical protein